MNIIEAILQYSFLQNAYIAGLIIAFVCPIFGVFVIAKHSSLIPDTISHTSFAASTLTTCLIGFGILPQGFPSLYLVLFFAVLTAIIISYINTNVQEAKEVALSFVLTVSLGVAIILYQISPIKTALSDYLFGNIVAMTTNDVIILTLVAISALLFIWKYYRILLISTFDAAFAQTKGIKLGSIETWFYIILALIIAASTKFVGVLLISALMNLPVMIVMPFTKSYKETMGASIIVSIVMMLIGLIISYYQNLPTSGVVAVLLGVSFLLAMVLKKFKK